MLPGSTESEHCCRSIKFVAMQFYTMGQVKSNLMLQGKTQFPAERRQHFSLTQVFTTVVLAFLQDRKISKCYKEGQIIQIMTDHM